MANTPVLALPYPTSADTADVPRDVRALADALDLISALKPPLAAALPGAPVDGQEIYFQNATMAAAGVVWRLRYRAAGGTYKWEFVGGGELVVSVAASEATGSTAFVDLTTVGPEITVPLVGEYDILIAANISHGAAAHHAFMAPKLGAAAALDSDAAQFYSTVAGQDVDLARPMRRTMAAVGAIRLQYRSDSAGLSAQFARRELRVRPVRLG